MDITRGTLLHSMQVVVNGNSLAIRHIGKYDKPFLRPPKWHEFVVAHGLSGDDAEYGVVFYKDNNGDLQVRGLKKYHSPLFGLKFAMLRQGFYVGPKPEENPQIIVRPESGS
ncbi:hypothetical protein GH714_020042 [Hevea brasiliensis]|uniref:TF-B3 domain-containing protein n=1 Tax=Hevea brasiliensis TaxID=3981 RepID=A0A6A6N4U4_HEVBR|nr:hypothetical protein GH714_020042 [Hevea brasiliensis]